MSYILDALKKSEQERQKSSGPTLQTIQRPPLVTGRSGAGFWFLMLLCVALSLALVAAVWRFWQPGVIGSTSTPQVKDNTQQQQMLSDNKNISNTSAEQHNSDTATQRADDKAAASSEFDVVTPDKPQASADKQPRIVEFWELPDPVQKEVPALTFSFHVYSENPLRRTIIINKRRVKEGDVVADGLTLVEITVDGVVLNWKRFYFRINVIEQW